MRSRCSSAAALLLIVLVLPARAQTLDLGGGSAPVIDASTASGELAAFLLSEADEIDARDEVPASLRASSAVRRLAAAMLAHGQSLGARGGPRLVIARTIVTHLEAIDAALAAGALAARAALLADDCLRLAADLPTAQHELDRALRDAFAPLTNALDASVPAWPRVDPPPKGAAPSLASHVEAPPERVVALSELDALLTRARSWPSHRASADRTAALVEDALPVLDPPAWIDPDVRLALAQVFDAAITDMRDPALADAAIESLDHLGAVRGFIAAVDTVEPITARRQARLRAQPLLAAIAEDPERVARACRIAERVILQATDERPLRLEAFLPTFAGVAWRHAEAELGSATARLVDAMLERLDAPDPSTEPALLAAIRAQRQPRERLADLSRIGVYLTGVAPTDEPSPRRPKILADRRLLGMLVLKLGKQLGDEETAPAATEQLALIVALVRAAEPTEREVRLRELVAYDEPGADLVRQATGGEPERLFDELDDIRESAGRQLQIRAQGGTDSGSEIDRARGAAGLLDAIAAAVTVTTLGRDRLDAWAAWELTEHGWAALLDDLPGHLARATDAVLEGEAVDDERFATVLLCAHLAERLPDLPEDPPEDAAAASSALRQIALGVPERSALGAEHREPIAAICRDLEELASARLRGETDRVRALEARIADAAIRILEIEHAK